MEIEVYLTAALLIFVPNRKQPEIHKITHSHQADKNGQFVLLNVLRWNLHVVNEKIFQETGKKIRESKSVQKSAKKVHVTFKVRRLQLLSHPPTRLSRFKTDLYYTENMLY